MLGGETNFYFLVPGVRGLSPDRGVSLVMMKIYSVFGLFQWVYLLGDETNFIFLRSESPPGSATMGSEFDVP